MKQELEHMQIICTSLKEDNHASTSSLIILQARCSSWCPTNSVRTLKALKIQSTEDFSSTEKFIH